MIKHDNYCTPKIFHIFSITADSILIILVRSDFKKLIHLTFVPSSFTDTLSNGHRQFNSFSASWQELGHSREYSQVALQQKHFVSFVLDQNLKLWTFLCFFSVFAFNLLIVLQFRVLLAIAKNFLSYLLLHDFINISPEQYNLVSVSRSLETG